LASMSLSLCHHSSQCHTLSQHQILCESAEYVYLSGSGTHCTGLHHHNSCSAQLDYATGWEASAGYITPSGSMTPSRARSMSTLSLLGCFCCRAGASSPAPLDYATAWTESAEYLHLPGSRTPSKAGSLTTLSPLRLYLQSYTNADSSLMIQLFSNLCFSLLDTGTIFTVVPDALKTSSSQVHPPI